MEHHQLLNKMASWIPWTKSGKRPSADDEEPNLLLSLLHPDVTHVVLDHLDPKSLLTLRVVCKRTKSWVDHPQYMSKLRITLHSSVGSKKMRKVLKAKADFCNFRIGFENHYNEDLIAEIGQRFGPFIRVLDINTVVFPTLTVNLFRQCPVLESLSLLGLNLSKLTPTDIDDLKGMSNIFLNLKYLSVGSVQFVEEQAMEYFRILLKQCTNLKILRLPYLTYNSKLIRTLRYDIFSKYIIDAVTSNILERSQRAPSSNLKYLILEFVNPGLPPNLFLSLANTCYQSKTILNNVHESQLRISNPSRFKTSESLKAQEIIGTLDGLNENILLGRLINLTCITIRISHAALLADMCFTEPKMPKLQTINLFFDAAEEDAKVNKLVTSILEVERPTVNSLKISYIGRRGDISADLVKPLEIANNFQYLRKLDIYQWEAFDEEFLLLWKGIGSHRIQDLSLLLCTNLSDRGLLGDDPKNPAILNLKDLKELHISSFYGSITDVSITRAIRHMPLQKLRLYSQSVTYDGISSLLDGAFYSNIDYVHFSKPLDCTQKEFYYLLKDILSAKSCPDFHKRKHLRRRSQPLVPDNHRWAIDEPSCDDD